MKLLIVAVGQRVPDWAQTACNDYAKRLPPELKLELKAVKTEPRAGKTLASLLAAERGRIEADIPRGAQVGALDERGTRPTPPAPPHPLPTRAWGAGRRAWPLAAPPVARCVGGPDGLDPALPQAAHERIRLSDLTLPHALVRVLLIEQIYRAWSLHAGHPYHRE